MSILITGGAGYIGSHTARLLSEQGFETVVYDNLSRGYEWAVQWSPLVKGDLGNRDLLRKTLVERHIDAVIHFAAFIAVGESMQAPGQYFSNNVSNTLNLFEAMKDVGVKRLVFSSTAAVYGDPTRIPLTEDHPKNPVSPYGESKLMIERALHWYGVCHGFRWAALRYFNACGAHPDGKIGEFHEPETHLLPNVLRAAIGTRQLVDVYGTDYPTPDGTAIRDYIHVLDLAAAHMRALEYLKGGGESGAFNLGTGQGHSVREVIAAVENTSGRKVPVKLGPRRAGDPPELVADSSRAVAVLGWKPEMSNLATIVETAWRWENARTQTAGPASDRQRLLENGTRFL